MGSGPEDTHLYIIQYKTVAFLSQTSIICQIKFFLLFSQIIIYDVLSYVRAPGLEGGATSRSGSSSTL